VLSRASAHGQGSALGIDRLGIAMFASVRNRYALAMSDCVSARSLSSFPGRF